MSTPWEKEKYLFHISHTTKPLNKQENDIQCRLKCCDNTLMTDKQGFINQIVNTVERVNQSYKSKPIKLYLYDTHIHVLRHDSHCILTAKLITIQTDLT